MSPTDERRVNPISEMIRISQTILKLDSWGFKETYRALSSRELIYDSEHCRINLIWDGWDYMGGNSMHVLYGRLHAPSEGHIMIWNGEECYCWHDFDLALHFLDGRRPADIVEQYYSHPVISPFYTDEIKKKYHRQAEWLAEMHVSVWEHYGQRFFELFDVRQSNVWEHYRQFLREFYDIKGRGNYIDPSLDKVC